jgi:hypothetical protein
VSSYMDLAFKLGEDIPAERILFEARPMTSGLTNWHFDPALYIACIAELASWKTFITLSLKHLISAPQHRFGDHHAVLFGMIEIDDEL